MDTDLFEISREDDSLLQQTLNEDSCSVFSSSSFSPLCSARPPKPSPRTSSLMAIEESKVPGCSSKRECFNKENLNVNRPEMPKLSIDPQQMKRKKKGGGYNLRKSLAWDRAFFTEEGVLDPMELSMISGNANNLGGEKLSVIHEEGRESLSDIPDQQNDSMGLLVLEEKLFKDLPVKSTTRSKKAIGSSSQKQPGLAKNNGLLTSPAKRGVLSAQDINRSGSKRSGCPRPAASSSPAYINTTKAAAKEMKVLRMPVAKKESGSAISSTKSSTHGGHLKRTQSTRPVVAEKNVRVRGSLSSTKTVAGRAITGPGGKSSTSKSTLPQAERNVGKVASKLSSSTPVKTSTQVKISSEGMQDQVNPLLLHVLNGQDDDSTKVEISHPQSYVDMHVPNVPIETAKPSGLRMPSPSIRFFDQQPKASTSLNSVNKCLQRSNIPLPTRSISRNPNSLKNFHGIRPPLDYDRVQQLISNSPSAISDMASSASTSLSTSSHEKVESHTGFYGMQKTEPMAQNDLTDEILSNQKDLHNTSSDVAEQSRECIESCAPDKQLHLDDGNVKLNEEKSLTSSKPCWDLKEYEDEKLCDVAFEPRDTCLDRRVDIQENSHVGFTLQVGDVSTANIEEPFLLSNEAYSSFSPQSQSTNAHFHYNRNISTLANQIGPSAELQKDDCAEISDCVSKQKEDTASTTEGFCTLSGFICKEQAADDSAGSKVGSWKLHVEDAGSTACDENLANSGAVGGDKKVISCKNVVENFTKDTQAMGCQNMDHSLSTTVESILGSQDPCSNVDLGNQAELSEKMTEWNEELSSMANEGWPMGAATATMSDGSPASLSNVIFSKMTQEADHSVSLLANAVKDENCPQKGDLSEHENAEDSQFHPCVHIICQGASSPTSGTDKVCIDESHETLNGYSRGEQRSDCKNVRMFQPQIVDSGVWETDNPQVPQEDESTDLADAEVDGANDTGLKMVLTTRMKMEFDHSIFLLANAEKDENSSHKGDLTEHENVEDSQLHPQIEITCQDASSPTGTTDKLCFDETLNGYSKGEQNSDYNDMTIIQTQTVDSGVRETDQAPQEDEYTDLADVDVNGVTGPTMQVSGNSAAKNDFVTAANLFEQPDDHPDLQDCLVEYDRHLSEGGNMDDNSSHDSRERSLDNAGCESKLSNCSMLFAEEPEPHGGLDIVDGEAGNRDGQDILSDLLPHENNPSPFTTTLEVDASQGMMIVDKITEPQSAAYDEENYPPIENDHLESGNVNVDSPLDSSNPSVQQQYYPESIIHPTEHADETLPQELCKNSQKQNSLQIKPPPYAPPFSDEWLAALEAAGEEILTMKSGAVQNSPPDKTLPEPGPWSPVKKKHNQGIGPFDCTKFTNATTQSPHSGS